MKVRFRITNKAALQRGLRQLGDTEARKVLVSGTMAAAEVVRKEVVGEASRRRRTGLLARSIIKFLMRRVSVQRGAIVVKIAARRTAFYVGFLERGTRNMRARPIFAPAFARAHGRAFQTGARTIGKRMEAAANRIGRQVGKARGRR